MKRIGYKILLIGLVFFSVIRCTFYYKTSDIDKSLFDMVKAVNSNHQSVQQGFKNIQQEYNKLKSLDNEDPFLTAREKINTLETSLEEVTVLRNNVNSEYTEFKKYSKGINSIASNSQEWGYLKQTKKNMKTLKKEITNKGETFVKLVNEFKEYVELNIYPLVKIYKVSDYKLRYTKTISNLKKLKAENLKLLNQYTLIYNDLNKKFATSNQEQCVKLKSCLEEISKKSKEFEFIKRSINRLLKTFIENTKGISEIYNTDPFWDVIQQNENKLDEKVKEIQLIQQNIKTAYSQFQIIANELKAQ